MPASVLVALTLMAAADAPRPSLKEQVDETAGARFGMAHVCIPAVTTADPSRFDRLIPARKPQYPGQKSYYVGPDVTLSTNGLACTVRASSGPAAKLREAVLEALRAAAPDMRPVFDSGVDGRDGSGRYRQEGYCLRLGERSAYAVISTSPERGRTPLQATLGPSDGRTCRDT